MEWKLVIFDLDGTLIDTINDLGSAVNHVLLSAGMPLHTMEDYRLMVGGGIRNLVYRALPEEHKNDEKLLDSLLKEFVTYYSAHISDFSRPYDGMPELLKDLSERGKVRLAVASNKFQAGTQTLIERLYPEVAFDCVYGGRDGFPLKPDPAVVQGIMKECGVGSSSCIMVGDSAVDIKTAAAAGIASVAVSWGFRPAEAAEGATFKVSSVEKLKAVILSGCPE